MPGYVVEALEKYQHVQPKRIQRLPHKWNQPAYGKRQQFAKEDKLMKLDAKGKTPYSVNCWSLSVLWTGHQDTKISFP